MTGQNGGGSRRSLLKGATFTIGGVLAGLVGFPLLRVLLFPVTRKTVTEPADKTDVLALDDLEPGGPPQRVVVKGAGVRDGWSVADDVALGSVWLRRRHDDTVEALSSVCPHLGCAIDFDGNSFKCPCHRSTFSLTGERASGPAKRGLDPLVAEVRDGRVLVAYRRLKQDTAEREEA